jgi:1,4-alpha-glucan branching enzyme
LFDSSRYKIFQGILQKINETEGGIEQFSRGYERFGLTKQEDGLTYREWAPGAKAVHLIGDFSKSSQLLSSPLSSTSC